MTIVEKYHARVKQVNSLVCVGLDSDFDKLPPQFKTEAQPQFAFNKWIIDQTHDLVAAYKPNAAFYEARGSQGWAELQMTMDYLEAEHPEIVTILDAKRADIGSTNQGYVTAIFDQLGFDAVTLHPYLGQEALQPFLNRADKACIILCKTSNPGAGELQDLTLSGQSNKPVWQHVAEIVSQQWNHLGNCMLVVGATYPADLAKVRQIAPEMVFLVPGIGAQGGEVEALKAGLTNEGGLIVNSSRGIIFDQHPQQAAQTLRDQLNQLR